MVFPTHIVAAGGVVENDKNEILLVKTHNAGWVYPGGQVETGENLIDALMREIKEESGVSVAVEKLFAVTSNTGSYKGYNGYETVPTKVMFDFICKYTGGKLTTSDENSETMWVKKDEVMSYISTPAYRERYQAYLNFDGNTKYLEYVTRPEFELKLKRNI